MPPPPSFSLVLRPFLPLALPKLDFPRQGYSIPSSSSLSFLRLSPFLSPSFPLQFFFTLLRITRPPHILYRTLIFFLPARRLYLASLSSLPDLRWKVRFSDGESLIYRGDVLAGGNYAKASASITDGEILKPFTGITGERVESGGGERRESPRFP